MNNISQLRLVSSACALLLFFAVPIFAAPPERPKLSVTQAATIAEAELTKRGLAADHYISSLYFMPASKDRTAHFRASIIPPILFDASAKQGETPNYLQLRIEMDGSVTAEGFHMREPQRRIRLEVQEPQR